MDLLTITKDDSGLETGGTADIYLEIIPGSGRVFIDSYPLSKLDTQSSTRYANKVACQFANKDCSNYDFLYTIRANASVIGGPSAGAAITILTASLLLGDKLRDDAVITGTINSGELIGPVGGTYEKAKAAQEIGMNFVLISELTPEKNFSKQTNVSLLKIISININSTNSTNSTADDNNSNVTISKIFVPEKINSSEKNNSHSSSSNVSVGGSVGGSVSGSASEEIVNENNLTINVKKIFTLEEAYDFFTGKPYVEHHKKVIVNKDYLDIMGSIKDDLCARSQELYKQSDSNITLSNKTNITDPYSLASLCYSDALKLRVLEYKDKNKKSLLLVKSKFKKRIFDFKKALSEREISNLAELETYLIVKERVSEAEIVLNKLEDNQTQEVLANGLSFVYERLNSANAWSAFFQMPSEEIVVNKETLKKACDDAKGEAIERISYLALYLPKELVLNLYEDMEEAEQSTSEGDYAYCIFKSVQTKAETNMLLSGVFTEKDKVSFFIDKKLLITSDLIAKEISKNHFPIAGYSYYKYAETLKERNPYSAMLFSEYALELSNLDLYFPKEKPLFHINTTYLAYYIDFFAFFVSGLLLGLAFSLKSGKKSSGSSNKKQKNNKKRKKQKK